MRLQLHPTGIGALATCKSSLAHRTVTHLAFLSRQKCALARACCMDEAKPSHSILFTYLFLARDRDQAQR